MKLNKTVKKIAALSLGASMVGATLLGAIATADLGNFPSMFINADGKFDGVFVVGKNSKAEDIIGQNMLVSAVQVVAVKKTPIVGATATKTVAEGYEIGNKDVYFAKNISSVDSQFTDSDLPTLLADGTYVDNEGNNKATEEYTQKIYLPAQKQTMQIVHEQDDDAAPNAGVYLYLRDSDSHYTYNYTLKFDSAITVDNSSSASMSADIEGTKIKIMGKDYSIVDAKYTSGDLKEIKFLGGESLAWMSQGEKVTLAVSGTDHTVEMVDVTEVASSGEITACGFLIDGQSAWVDKGTTETVNGVVLGVTDGKAIHSEGQNTDVCQVAIGANSVTIRDNQEVKLGDEKVSDVTSSYAIGYIDYAPGTSAATAEKWNEFAYRVNPDNDKLYLAAGDEFVDPVFGTFKIVYSELVEDNKEKIEIKTSGKNGHLTFLNKDDKEVKIDFKSTTTGGSGAIYLGTTATSSEVDNMIYLQNHTCVGSSSVTECKGAEFIVSSTSNCEAHLIRISNIDTVDDKISFEDETYGTETNDVTFSTSNTSLALSGVSDALKVQIDESAKTIDFKTLGDTTNCYLAGDVGNTGGGLSVKMKTQNEGFVYINYTMKSGANTTQNTAATFPKLGNISFAEYADTGHAVNNSFAGASNSNFLSITPMYDSASDNVLELEYDTAGIVLGSSDTGYAFAKNDMSDTDDDNKQTVTYKGSWITIDDDSSKQSIVIEHPKVGTYARIFVAPTTSTTEISTAGTYTTEIQQIGVDQFKLDTEVTDVTAVNVVAVGGPCANSVVSALMGNPAECFTAMGIEAGQGMIKLFEDATTGKVALVVAGQTAEDTRLASQMVANYANYALKGDEVVAITVNEAALSWKTKAELAAEAAAAPAPVVEEVVAPVEEAPVVEETTPTE